MLQYAIFRVGDKKIKSIEQLRAYTKHAEREMLVPNADMEIKNEILIGTSNILKDSLDYIKDVKLRKNSVLARDLLLTASPEFFKKATEEQKRKWIETNVKWLKDNFGDNCIYASLHSDESTPHITAIVIPRFYDPKKQKYILANARYFDGIAKMSQWQDKYADAMKSVFKELNRGIKFSKAYHTRIRHFYTLIEKELDTQELQSLCAKAKYSELQEIKIKNLQKTLNLYKDFKDKSDTEKQEIKKHSKELYNQITDIKRNEEVYKETIKTMARAYKIPQQDIVKILDYVQEKMSNSKDKNINKTVADNLELSK